ncbi:hypothetical protein V865_000943 [Kwoniella europaea PYCC6329]|uniref:Uncharacterized protein n=1 Tax=Kwoniella europaea PYCC6329 TaxID=1423913 RepID=A0AAX4K8U2_9TREE
MVIESEKDLAATLDKFVEDHPNTYDFIAKTFDGKIVIQIRFEDDTVGIEGFFTETEELLDDLDVAQKSILGSISLSDDYNDQQWGGTTLETLQGYRYGAPDELEKRLICQPCRGCLRDINEHLKKRVSLCGQFCSTRLSCVVPGCQRCYYTGGACLWQKSCQRVSLSHLPI